MEPVEWWCRHLSHEWSVVAGRVDIDREIIEREVIERSGALCDPFDICQLGRVHGQGVINLRVEVFEEVDPIEHVGHELLEVDPRRDPDLPPSRPATAVARSPRYASSTRASTRSGTVLPPAYRVTSLPPA